MTVYVLAELSIHDPERYRRYVERFPAVLARHGGTLLVADTRPEVLEGSWDGDKVVLISFPDAVTLRAWASSPEYRAIAVDRVAGTDAVVLLLNGISSAGEVP